MALNANTTVQQIIDFASMNTSLQTFFNVGGVTNEPGMTICNNTQQVLLVRPMPWKFNRHELAGQERGSGNFFVTQYGVQDYRFGGACCFVLNNNLTGTAQSGGACIDLASSPINGGIAGITVAGAVTTVQTTNPHPFQVGSTVFHSGCRDNKFNSVYSFDPVAKTSTWSGGFLITTVSANRLQYTFATPAGCTATITNVTITNNVAVFNSVNSFAVGEQGQFSGVGTNTFLNGQQMTITAVSGSTFTGTIQHADVVSGADTGTFSLTSGAAGFGTVNSSGIVTGLPAFGWMESASVQDINSTQFPQPEKPIDAVRNLPPGYGTSNNPLKVCMLIDLNNGLLKFRLSEPLGTQCMQINVIFQKRAPVLRTPQDVFAWPDDMAYVLHEVALYQAFRYARGVKAADTLAQMQIAQSTIASALVGEDREDTGNIISPKRSLMMGA